MCTGAEPAAASACAAGSAEAASAAGTANALTMGADYAGLGAMGDMAATGTGALGMGAMTAGELGAGFGANMAASGYGSTAAEGLGALGGADIGAANAGTMGSDYAAAFGQGGIAPQASSLGADIISPATNLPAEAMTGNADKAALLSNEGYGPTSTGLGDMFSNAGSWMAKNPLLSIYGGASLYDMYAKNQMAGAQQNQMNKINSMYAPGSPEYNLMMQQIARKDAAAGRNSQYGPRAQTLAGTIADKKASLLGSSGYQNLANSQLNNKFGAMNTPVSLATMYALTNK